MEEAALLFAAGEPSEPFSPAGTALVLDILVTELHPGPLYRSGEAYTRLLFSLLDDGRLGILTEEMCIRDRYSRMTGASSTVVQMNFDTLL